MEANAARFGVSVRSTAGCKDPFTRGEGDLLLAKLFEGATLASKTDEKLVNVSSRYSCVPAVPIWDRMPRRLTSPPRVGGPVARMAPGGIWRQNRGGHAEMSRRIFLAIMSLLIASASATAATNAIAADPNVFMNELWGRTVEVLGKNVPRTERLARFRQLFQADFDVPGIARFVLGRYWRSASEQEQQEYLKLFENYVVFVYGTRLSSFSG